MSRRPEQMRANEINKRSRQRLKEWQALLDSQGFELLEREWELRSAETRLSAALNVRKGIPTARSIHFIAAALIDRPDLRPEFIALLEARRSWTQSLADHLLEVMAYYRLVEARILAKP